MVRLSRGAHYRTPLCCPITRSGRIAGSPAIRMPSVDHGWTHWPAHALGSVDLDADAGPAAGDVPPLTRERAALACHEGEAEQRGQGQQGDSRDQLPAERRE